MKVNRHAKIIELINKYHIETQEELAKRSVAAKRFLVLFGASAKKNSPRKAVPLSGDLPCIMPPVPLHLLPFPRFLRRYSVSRLSS